MITYKNNVEVYVGKKHVGTIKQVDGGFQYQPKNSRLAGDVFKSISAVQRSLEEE